MAKSVRVGAVYRWVGWNPLNHGLKEGQLLRVVNIPGGSYRGVFRHVLDAEGQTHFVHIRNLESRLAH